MKITNPFIWKSVGFAACSLLRNLIATIDLKAAFYDVRTDPAIWSENRNFIFMMWHEHIIFPIFARRNTNGTMLLSQHGDAEVVNQIAALLGMKTIRGSSFRGGTAAIKKLLSEQQNNIVAFTPDGPRGPRRQMSAGPIFLASKTQLPIVLGGFGFSKFWRANSWDKFVIPKPFCRGRMILSPMFNIPPQLKKDDLEHYRLKMETTLTQLTDFAEEWAVSGATLKGESVICPGPKCSLMYYGADKKAETETD
ncbi:MAG: lysophospholipid acyltransferase family protein [Planctomycetaceae bacterium]|nr:lysophospholipid acyltransferase family protein [Planctomycetaceae bacterium]